MYTTFFAGILLAFAWPAGGASAPVSPADASPLVTAHASRGQIMHASGTFQVKLDPQAASTDDASAIGRMRITKQFHGDLEATSEGQMLAYSSDVEGSAGYVAMERVTGTLGGRKGSFVLQHGGSMDRGAPSLSVSVVPDSGTGELAGLTGRMQIEIADGKHSYDFEYTLDAGR